MSVYERLGFGLKALKIVGLTWMQRWIFEPGLLDGFQGPTVLVKPRLVLAMGCHEVQHLVGASLVLGLDVADLCQLLCSPVLLQLFDMLNKASSVVLDLVHVELILLLDACGIQLADLHEAVPEIFLRGGLPVVIHPDTHVIGLQVGELQQAMFLGLRRIIPWMPKKSR